MPQAFLNCMKKKGHRVRTIKPKPDVYIHVCFYKGKSYRGEVHHERVKKLKKYIKSHPAG